MDRVSPTQGRTARRAGVRLRSRASQPLVGKLIAVAVSMVVLGVFAPAAAARKVGNPTSALGVNLDAATLDFHAGLSHDTYTGPSGFVHGATISPGGDITVPALGNVAQVKVPVPGQAGVAGAGICTWSLTNGSVTVVPTALPTAKLDPFTGQVTVD